MKATVINSVISGWFIMDIRAIHRTIIVKIYISKLSFQEESHIEIWTRIDIKVDRFETFSHFVFASLELKIYISQLNLTPIWYIIFLRSLLYSGKQSSAGKTDDDFVRPNLM